MLALDAYSHASHEYTVRLIEARKIVEKNNRQSLELIPDIEIRNVSENSIDILLGVQSKLALYAITRTASKLLKPEAIPMRDIADAKFSVVARINSTVPIAPAFQEQALEQYNEAFRQLSPKHLLNIFPEGISGKDQHMYMPRPDLNDSN